jgi:hypothetical protein
VTRDSSRALRAALRAHLCAALAAFAVAGSGCAHAPHASRPEGGAPAVVGDSLTAGLWRMDETGGTHVADAGPHRIHGRAGIDTHTDFGRIRGARVFTRSVESFVLVPFHSAFEEGDGITIEAWIYINAYGQYEDTPIAARWTQQANEQSWMFSVLGLDTRPPLARLPSPGYHYNLLGASAVNGRGKLMFAYQPEDASPPRSFFSARAIPEEKWTHVAVTFDGALVRIWVDGELDAQFASRGSIRDSRADLVIGNSIDPRWLSEFGGELRVTTAPDMNPYYAFDGFIDELRISTVARPDFDYARSVGSR